MKKFSAGFICVLLSVVIAVITVGCGNGGELSYTGDSQLSSSEAQLSSLSTSSESSAPSQNAETVLYQLTTQQGETVQVLSTTEASTSIPTVNYDPVTVPSMGTTYLNTTEAVTTQAATTAAFENTTNAATTTTTKQTSASQKIKYVDVNDTMASTSGDYIVVLAKNDKFGKKINSGSGTLVIECSGNQMNTKYSVLKDLDSDGYVQIKISIPSELESIIESTSDAYASIKIAKGTIVCENGISNNEFRSTLGLN